MKLFNFLLLYLFFITEPKYYVEGSCYSKYLATECKVCDQTPCQCIELILEEDDKPSLKKVILLFIERTSLKFGHGKGCEECFHNCPKKHWINKVLTDILRQASHCKKDEEQTLRRIILKALDPATCEQCPCQDYCDPMVQRVLRCILKRATGCDCTEFPCECMFDSPPCGKEHSKYWFRTTKEELRKEMKYKPQNKSPSCCKKFKCQKKKYNEVNKYSEYPVSDELNNLSKCENNRAVSKCKRKIPRSCKSCRKPNELICSRYFDEDSENLFSICAEAKQCRIKPLNLEGNVALSCTQCKPITSPFVQFTRNGCPFRETNEGQYEIQIRTKFLQINDLTQTSESREKEVFNPFAPKNNYPRKKKSKCKKL